MLPGMRRLVLIAALCCLWLPALAGEGSRSARSHDGQVGLVLGHHHTWRLNFPAFFPMLEFRAGYQVSDQFLVRIDIGMGASKVTNTDRESFEGGTLMMGNLGITLLWTPRIAQDLYLCLGATTGPWFTALWGDELAGVGVSAGSNVKYLESVVIGLGGVIGLEWNLSRRWALQLEARYNTARGDLGGSEYDFGGLSVFGGFLYRLPAYHPEVH